jgi:hypothetical protein
VQLGSAELSSFELSRIYAKGWNAARAGQIDIPDEALDAFIKTSNPYATAAERARWEEGFKAGLRRKDEIDGRKLI